MAEVQEGAGCGAGAEAADEGEAAGALDGSEGLDVPLRALGLVDADVGGFAAHGEADVVGEEVTVDVVGDLADAGPGLVGEGFGEAGGLVEAGDGHAVAEVDARLLDGAADGGGLGGGGGADEGDVAFGGEEAGGGIEADPAGSGEEDLGPGVEVGGVLRYGVRGRWEWARRGRAG